MTGREPRRFTRRDLFGIFGQSTKGFRNSIERAAPQLTGRAPPESAAPQYERRLRPQEDTLPATSDGHDGFVVDMRTRPLMRGETLRIAGSGLAEPLLAVRVNEHHVGVMGGECPVDGSDLLWLAPEDRAGCPACGSRWRLDGSLTRGPADCRMGTYLVDDSGESLRLRAVAG